MSSPRRDEKIFREFTNQLENLKNVSGFLYPGSEFKKSDIVNYFSKLQFLNQMSNTQVEHVRKQTNTWFEDQKIVDPKLKQLLYQVLLLIAANHPNNAVDEDNQPIDGSDLIAIEEKDRIIASDGYQYNINTLATWIKTRGAWINYNRIPFNEFDKKSILNFANQLGFDLSHLSTADHEKHIREIEEKLSLDTAQSLQNNQPQRHYSAGQRISFFRSGQEELLIMLSQITHIEPEVLTVIADTDPYAFENMSNLIDYLRVDMLSADEIIRRTHLPNSHGGFNQMRVTHLALAFPFVQRGVLSIDEALDLNEKQVSALLSRGEKMDRNECRSLIGLRRGPAATR